MKSRIICSPGTKPRRCQYQPARPISGSHQPINKLEPSPDLISLLIKLSYGEICSQSARPLPVGAGDGDAAALLGGGGELRVGRRCCRFLFPQQQWERLIHRGDAQQLPRTAGCSHRKGSKQGWEGRVRFLAGTGCSLLFPAAICSSVPPPSGPGFGGTSAPPQHPGEIQHPRSGPKHGRVSAGLALGSPFSPSCCQWASGFSLFSPSHPSSGSLRLLQVPAFASLDRHS